MPGFTLAAAEGINMVATDCKESEFLGIVSVFNSFHKKYQENTMKYKRFMLTLVIGVTLSSCATLTNDPNQQIQFVGMNCGDQTVTCTMSNKRGSWSVELPGSAMIRRSDDALRVECSNPEGERYLMTAKSRIGAKIIASAVFLDFGIVDAITDKHREYPEQVLVDCDASNSEISETE